MEDELKIRVDELSEEGTSIRCHLPINWLSSLESLEPAEGVPEILLASPVSIDIWAYRSGVNVFVKGSINTSVRLECARCLKAFNLGISSSLRLTLCPAKGMLLEKEVELHPEDLEFSIYQGNEIDLGHVISQEIILSVPMKPLCKQNCRGLCADCGTDLNDGDCPCKKRSEDPRFAILKDLKIDK